MLGQGCFGIVYKGEVEAVPGEEDQGPVIVAIKTLKNIATDQEKRDLKNELAVMKMLDPHPNVVRLLGCCTEKGDPWMMPFFINDHNPDQFFVDPIFVIMELVRGPTLQEHLINSRSRHNYDNLHGDSLTLSSRDLTSFAYQV